jgi:predicted transcriptional regulator
MSDALSRELRNPGPHTAESLAEKLPHFTVERIREALEVLAAQGVLERVPREDGGSAYRYVDPSRYVQANLDVVSNPAADPKDRSR